MHQNALSLAMCSIPLIDRRSIDQSAPVHHNMLSQAACSMPFASTGAGPTLHLTLIRRHPGNTRQPVQHNCHWQGHRCSPHWWFRRRHRHHPERRWGFLRCVMVPSPLRVATLIRITVACMHRAARAEFVSFRTQLSVCPPNPLYPSSSSSFPGGETRL